VYRGDIALPGIKQRVVSSSIDGGSNDFQIFLSGWMERRIQSQIDARVWLSKGPGPNANCKSKQRIIMKSWWCHTKRNNNNENSKTTINDDGGGRSRQQ
jgi:hypothetical protein